jgi:hypothetical protein
LLLQVTRNSNGVQQCRHKITEHGQGAIARTGCPGGNPDATGTPAG